MARRGGLSQQTTLLEFFQGYFRPIYLGENAAAATISEYRTAVDRWAKLTGDPALRDVDQMVLARFLAEDGHQIGRRGQRISPNTVRKHGIELQLILNLAGPRSRDCRQAATEDGLFGLDRHKRPRAAPWFNLPAARDKLPTDCFTLAEITAWIEACRWAGRPRLAGVAPAVWWQSLVRFLYNSGVRIRTALALRREWVRRHGSANWAEIPGPAYKGGRPHLIHLSAPAREALDAVSAGGTPELVFFGWPYSMTHLHQCRIRLLERAGLPPERRFGFHALRKALGSELWQRNRQAATLQLGHADGKVTEQSYAAPWVLGEALAAAVGPAMAEIPQP